MIAEQIDRGITDLWQLADCGVLKLCRRVDVLLFEGGYNFSVLSLSNKPVFARNAGVARNAGIARNAGVAEKKLRICPCNLGLGLLLIVRLVVTFCHKKPIPLSWYIFFSEVR